MAPTSTLGGVRRVNLVVPADGSPKAIQIVSELCCDVVPQWTGLLPSDLNVSVQAGGLSNVLYKVVGPLSKSDMKQDSTNNEETADTTNDTNDEGEATEATTDNTASTAAAGPVAYKNEDSHMVLVRVYGRGTESMVSRDAEVAFMSAFQPVYARFTNGHVYTFIQGECVKTEHLSEPGMMTRIARHMAWHQYTCESVEALHWRTTPAHDRSPAKAWANWGCEKMYELAVEALKERKEHLSDEKWEKLTSFDLPELKKKMNALRAHVQKYDSVNPLTLCHNDVFPGNILNTEAFTPITRRVGETGIAFIDFEYSYTNYGLYDVANHFNEWTGLELDQKMFPKQEQAKAFVRAYLEEWRRVRGDVVPVSHDDVHQAYSIAMKLTLVSNCLWFFWSITQACNSGIKFDYVEYAQKRLEAWWMHEEEFLALDPEKRTYA